MLRSTTALINYARSAEATEDILEDSTYEEAQEALYADFAWITNLSLELAGPPWGSRILRAPRSRRPISRPSSRISSNVTPAQWGRFCSRMSPMHWPCRCGWARRPNRRGTPAPPWRPSPSPSSVAGPQQIWAPLPTPDRDAGLDDDCPGPHLVTLRQARSSKVLEPAHPARGSHTPGCIPIVTITPYPLRALADPPRCISLFQAVV